MKFPTWVNSFGLSFMGLDSISIPELRGLDAEEQRHVIVEALEARKLEKGQAMYRSVVEGRGVLTIVRSVLVGAVLLLGWYAVMFLTVGNGYDRPVQWIFWIVVIPFSIPLYIYARSIGRRRLRPYVLDILKKRENAALVER